METESKTSFDIPSDKEGNDAYDKFEDMFDEPREAESRKPSKASLALVTFFVAAAVAAGVWSFLNFSS